MDLFIHTFKLKIRPLECLHAFVMFYVYALREWAWPRSLINVTTITQFLYIEVWIACLHCLDLLCMYLHCVLLSRPRSQLCSVIYTEKLAFQCVILQS